VGGRGKRVNAASLQDVIPVAGPGRANVAAAGGGTKPYCGYSLRAMSITLT